MLRAEMANIAPFRALRPAPELAGRICELPYDVMSSEEAREIASGNPLSFLRVSKPEIDLPPGTDLYAPEVYQKGKENFDRLISQGALRRDAEPCYYIYRQIMGGHSQFGLVAAASCEDYLSNVIKKHEFTRPDKEDDRVRHIETLDAQTGPVFLVYRAVDALREIVKTQTACDPDVDFTAKDSVRHTAWVVSDRASVNSITARFRDMPALYIADGHHRCAAAARVFQTRSGAGESNRFLSVIFPHDEVQILPYNRVLKDLNGHAPSSLIQALGRLFDIKDNGSALPAAKGEMGFYFDRKWWTLIFKKDLTQGATAFERLDVELLQRHVLAPIFGIEDPRKSERIRFVGGIRGTEELKRLVDSGENACAFSMHPTGVEELMDIADAGGIMPPKSTWFEPKLRDAMFCHLLR
jgi:uncharacterized protein (DUF1015 family)